MDVPRDLTIKGQEILTADKVAIRVSILVQFAVVDPKAALHRVANYEDRLYSDVQLAAPRLWRHDVGGDSHEPHPDGEEHGVSEWRAQQATGP